MYNLSHGKDLLTGRLNNDESAEIELIKNNKYSSIQNLPKNFD